MNKKSIGIIIAVITLLFTLIAGYFIFNKVKADQAFNSLKSAENCAAVANYSQPQLEFLNQVEAFYMQYSTLKNVSITGSIYTFEAPSWDSIMNNAGARQEYLSLYLQYLCDTYPISSSEYLASYATNESYIEFLGSCGNQIIPIMENAISAAPMASYDVVNSGNPRESIHSELFMGFNYINLGADVDELASLMDILVADGTLRVAYIADGTYQAGVNLTDSVLYELELYGEGLTDGFEGEVEAYIDLEIDDGEFNLSIDEYAIIMAKFEYIEANGSTLVMNFTGLQGSSVDELEAYAVRMEYEGYDDMLNSIVHTIEGAIGNGYYETRVISGTYEFDGVNVVFHTDSGVMNGTYSNGEFTMILTVDGIEQELVFN